MASCEHRPRAGEILIAAIVRLTPTHAGGERPIPCHNQRHSTQLTSLSSLRGSRRTHRIPCYLV